MEQVPSLVAPRGSITKRAVAWAIGQLRREHATIQGLARQLGTSWKTVWRAVEPELVKLAADESRFENVTSLGVDEHVWHHVDPRRRGPKELWIAPGLVEGGLCRLGGCRGGGDVSVVGFLVLGGWDVSAVAVQA